MPRKSPFSIVLSKEERIVLEVQARQYTSPYCDVVRAKIGKGINGRKLERENGNARSFPASQRRATIAGIKLPAPIKKLLRIAMYSERADTDQRLIASFEL